MYQQLRSNGDKTGFWIVPGQEISKAEACIAFLMRLPSNMFAVFRVEDMLSQDTEKYNIPADISDALCHVRRMFQRTDRRGCSRDL